MNWSAFRTGAAVLALIVLSVLGFWGVDTEWRSTASMGQQLSVFTQTVYALLGLVAARALLARYTWSRKVLYLWAGMLIFTGLTAPLVWGGQGWLAGLFAGCICAVFAAVVFWLARPPPAG